LDRRIVRTRGAITHALVELASERRWEKITVQQLLDRAGVSRSTFYAHFDNKLDVLTSGIPDVADLIAVDPATGALDLAGLFAHVNEMADVFGALLAQPVLGEISAALERGLRDRLAPMIDRSDAPRLNEFLAGALMSSLRNYATLRDRPPPHEIATEIQGYVGRALEGHLQPPP
jgi:AcrR family transcriptional regulator